VTDFNILPWQQDNWDLLKHAEQNGRLPHAILLEVGCSLEKNLFAKNFSKYILCDTENCRTDSLCKSCFLLDRNSHPDLTFIKPEEKSQIIKVDQIRELVASSHETTSFGGYKVIIIDPADSLNNAAFNALLKTLEEPCSNTLLILISDTALSLPATISSRLSKIKFQNSKADAAIAWLKSQSLDNTESEIRLLLNIFENKPLRVIDSEKDIVLDVRQNLYDGMFAIIKNSDSPIQLATTLQKHDISLVLNLLMSFLNDVMRFKLINDESSILNFDYKNQFLNLNINIENLLCIIDKVSENHINLANKFNLNKQLLLEDILFEWKSYVSC